MTIALQTPGVVELPDVLDAMAAWQTPGAPFQLHPGDIGWFWRHGADAAAAAVRVWRGEGEVLAVGLLDEPDLLRVAISPVAQQDSALSGRLVADLAQPARGVLPEGPVCVESPPGSLLHDLLGDAGWDEDEPWSLLHRDLTDPVEEGIEVETAASSQGDAWAAVLASAFGGAVTEAEQRARWEAVRSGPAYAQARTLLARGADGIPAAAVTVWSAGPGRYGVLEPMGVHRDHRGRGLGRGISASGAAALREMGACSALVATTSSNVGAVATYLAAGFELVGERRDRRRPA